ncbi:MAG: SPOR domain-containing protein [Treponema sp.]|nr:SPOR domain-containing protein [Treponema sp.]
MEKKKLLLVAISAGVFLVAAIVAAIFVFSPKNPLQPAQTADNAVNRSDTIEPAASITPPAGTSDGGEKPAPLDAVELVRNNQDIPGLRQAPDGVIQEGSGYYVNGQGGYNSETVISVPKPTTAAVPDAPPPARKPDPAPRVTQTAPKPAATAAKPAASQTKIYDDYWVQTGAFSAIASAEGVKQNLASKGIISIIENRDVNGQTLFRVRVGPYTSQNEASYWLSLIKAIDGFEDSQIRQTQSRR